MRIRKAVIPAAGFGTRMLPFTKAVPKELIPLIDKPVLQYVVEEAVAADIKDILIVISSGKEAIIRHFNPAYDLEQRLEREHKAELLAEIRAIDKLAHIHYVYQQELNGLGDAVLQAENFIGNEPFAVLLGDVVMDTPVTANLVKLSSRKNCSSVALESVPKEKLRRYGVIGGKEIEPNIFDVDQLIEKPDPDKAPSQLAVAARYVFTPEIFVELHHISRGLGNELQLTDAMHALLKHQSVFGYRIEGKRYDLGSKIGFITANVEFALKRDDLHLPMCEYLEKVKINC